MSYTNLLYHIVYATKERAPLITTAPRLHEYLGGTVRGLGGIALEINGTVERVRKYIRNQEAHHQKQSFEEEFKALLHAHRIDFDETHPWG